MTLLCTSSLQLFCNSITLILAILIINIVINNCFFSPSIVEIAREVQAVTLNETFVQQNSIITLQNDRQTLKEEMSSPDTELILRPKLFGSRRVHCAQHLKSNWFEQVQSWQIGVLIIIITIIIIIIIIITHIEYQRVDHGSALGSTQHMYL